MRFNAASGGRQAFNYFYNWKVEFQLPCSRQEFPIRIFPGNARAYFEVRERDDFFFKSDSLEFLDQSGPSKSWFWDFGDASRSMRQNPVHLYQDSGQFVVILVSEGKDNCVDAHRDTIDFEPRKPGNATPPIGDGWSVFPNPANEIIALENPSFPPRRPFKLRLWSIFGKLIEEWEGLNPVNGQYQIDVSAYLPGIYILELQTSDSYISEKYKLVVNESPASLYLFAKQKNLCFQKSSMERRGGALLDLYHENSFQIEELRNSQNFSLWRYQKAMGLPAGIEKVSFGEGFTPLIFVNILGTDVQFKLDYLFPSGSYKDRGATVLISLAKHLGVQEVVQDSSGNAGAAIANYCALAGIDCRIFVPASTSPAKLVQLAAFGAKIELIEGSREATAAAAMKAADHAFYASHVWNPVFYEGTKTFAYEICEQRGWKAPDSLVLPAGNGTLLIGTFLGFKEMLNWGIIDKVPKIIGIQAANCAPLYQEFFELEKQASTPTLAEGIAIAEARRGAQMIDMVRQSKGTFIQVEEKQIEESLVNMCRRGYFIEPTSAAVVAGVEEYIRHHASAGEEVVSVLTGNGLKSSEKIQKLLKK